VPLRFEQVWGMLDGFPEGWRRYGVTHVVLSAGPQGEVGRAAIRGGTFLGADRRIQLWAVPHRPWASFAARVQAIPDAARALDATAAAIQTGRELVTVEADGPLPVADGRVLAVEKRAESLTVEAEADGPAVLVIAEAWWPGWVATLDGAPCEILPADVLLRAVRFPAGRHRLELRYAPPEVRHGLWLSALGLALLLGLAAWEARSQDGQSSTPASPVG
jgi:hypothetical protein